jgi:hypothetical protein
MMTRLFRFLTLGLILGGATVLLAASDAAPKYGCELLTAYVPMATALAADDLKTAQTAGVELAKLAEADGMTGIVARAKEFVAAPDITKARTVFKALSDDIEPLTVTEKNVTVMHCPMARASWVQPTGPVANPYYGKSMLRCGAPKVKP